MDGHWGLRHTRGIDNLIKKKMKINNKIKKEYLKEKKLATMGTIAEEALDFALKQFQKEIKEIQEFIEYNIKFKTNKDYHRLMDEIVKRFGDLK